MTQKKVQNYFSVGNLTRIAILAALASILFLVEIPVVAFYKLDLSNLPVLLGTFSMGVIPGLVILLLKSLIGLLHSSSVGVGELADFIMGAALIIPAGLIYHRNKTRKNAVIGMAAGTVCMVVIGILTNKFILLPFYIQFYPFVQSMDDILKMAKVGGIDTEAKLLLLITGPFNLLKGVVLSLVTALIYKPLSPILHSKLR
ncbi:MAG: ECF transporter S component [Clostridia bacterium]|nr:ECF transporter S component [Clostridia bacterium]